jgi:tetratricopeptide (TPR) repeat protein
MEIGLLAQLGWAIGEVEGLGSTAARDACQRAFALCRGADGGPELFKTLLGLWRGSSSWSGYAQSRELGERLLAVAEAAGDPQQLALARYALGNVHCALGNLDASIHHLRRCLKHYRPEMPVSLYGDSAGVGAHAFLGWAHSLRGAAGAGLREAQAAVALSRRLDHPPAIALALLFAAETHRLRREPAAALACAGEVVPVAEAAGIAAWGVFAEVFLGWGEALAGHRSGLERAARALDRVMDSIMAGTAAPLFALVAEAALAVGDRAHGLRATEEALTLMDENDGRHLQANLLLLRAELFAAGGDADAARACAREALTVAVGQGARLFELRAATLLLRLGVGGEAERDGILGRLQSLLRRGADGDELACRREARALVAAAGG